MPRLPAHWLGPTAAPLHRSAPAQVTQGLHRQKLRPALPGWVGSPPFESRRGIRVHQRWIDTAATCTSRRRRRRCCSRARRGHGGSGSHSRTSGNVCCGINTGTDDPTGAQAERRPHPVAPKLCSSGFDRPPCSTGCSASHPPPAPSGSHSPPAPRQRGERVALCRQGCRRRALRFLRLPPQD